MVRPPGRTQGCNTRSGDYVPTRDVCRPSKVSPSRRVPIPPPGAAVIEVDGLEKQYGDFPAVRGLSFTVQPGEVLGLVGPNGAGKTTTIRSIAGIIIPSQGRIRIGGAHPGGQAAGPQAPAAFIPDEPP